jgi:hypothetical protein
MIPIESKIVNNKLYIRLIALWILIEAFLGGIIHGLKLPVSGLFVGGSAMICIILIAHHFPEKGSVLKAMILVAIFKMMLSPHSPTPAYLAVFFQGILGEFLLKRKSYFAISSILFGIITMMESATQRILVLVFLYGSEFWKAVDVWLAKTTGIEHFNQFSIVLATGYLAMHFLVGAFLGWCGWRLSILNFEGQYEDLKIKASGNLKEEFLYPKAIINRRKGKLGLYLIWIMSVFFFIQAWLQPEKALLPANKIFELIFRFFIIASTWFLIIQPVLTMIIRQWLKGKKSELTNQISDIQSIIPEVKFLVIESWKRSGAKLSNLKLFLKILFFNLFHAENE